MSSAIAQVKITVPDISKWKRAGIKVCNTPTMSPPKGNPKVTLKGPGLLHVQAPGATIQFDVVSESGTNYYPLGIAFQLTKSLSKTPPDDPQKRIIGWVYFDPAQIQLNGTSLTIADDIPRRSEKIRDEFKFSIIIQDKKTGEIGVIDPGIENEN